MNKSKEAIIDDRRRQVAAMRLRGMTQREIVEGLESRGRVNDATGNPWSLAIVNRDLKMLKQEWREETMKDVAEHKARNLAELREARRMAWQDRKHYAILQGLKQEAELLGLDGDMAEDLANRFGAFLEGIEHATADVTDLSE